MSLLIHVLVHYVGSQHNSNFFLVCPWWTLPLPTVISPKFSPCRLSVGALSISVSNFASYFIKMLEIIHCRFPQLCTDRAISAFNLIFSPFKCQGRDIPPAHRESTWFLLLLFLAILICLVSLFFLPVFQAFHLLHLDSSP